MSYSHSKVKPRPILKHLSSASDSSVDSSSASSSLSRASRSHVQVHFPSHPHSLSSTHDAYSASAYDRSPILVAPNVCALPARGCPGQTYGAAVDAGSDADSASLDDVYGAGACDVDDITSSTPGRGWAGERSGRARVRIRGFDMSRLAAFIARRPQKKPVDVKTMTPRVRLSSLMSDEEVDPRISSALDMPASHRSKMAERMHRSSVDEAQL